MNKMGYNRFYINFFIEFLSKRFTVKVQTEQMFFFTAGLRTATVKVDGVNTDSHPSFTVKVLCWEAVIRFEGSVVLTDGFAVRDLGSSLSKAGGKNHSQDSHGERGEVMQVIKQVTERDLGILRDLYRFRVMNGEQIRRLYFGEHEAYTYRKLYIMRNSGWIRSRKIVRHLSDGSRIEAVHYITDRGLRVLREHQLIGDEEIEAKDLQIKKENMDSYLDFVDLYVELKDSGYTFVDSRELKKKYRMERGDLYKGSIINQDGNEYFVYIIKGGARESTLRRVLGEMVKTSSEAPLCRNLVLFRGVKSYDEFLGMMDSHVLASACLMPFGFACQYLRHYQGSQHLVNLITKHGEARENHDHLKSVYPYIIRCGESEKYVADLMMNDLALLDRMKRERHDKEVMVFTHELFSYDIEERLKDMRGIEVIEITDKELGIC